MEGLPGKRVDSRGCTHILKKRKNLSPASAQRQITVKRYEEHHNL